MVDNVAGDDVEPKPAKNEASGDVKPTVNVKPFKVKIPFQARIGKIEEPKRVPISVVFEGRDTASFFTTNARWREREELLDECRWHNFFHIGKNVKAKCITDGKVHPKPPKGAKVDKKELKKNKVKNREVVEKVVIAWRELVESPMEESYASNLLKFKEVCMPFP